MDTSTIDNGGGANDVDTVLPLSAGNYGASGAGGISWSSNNVLAVTLGANPTVEIGDTVNPSNAVKDRYGNIDNTTSTGPTISGTSNALVIN